jgi:hypothetical protein
MKHHTAPGVLRRTISALLVAAAACTSLMVPSPRAMAQVEAVGEDVETAGAMGSSLRKSTVESMLGVLDLPADQRKNVLDLFATFKGQVNDATKKVMEFQQGLGPQGAMPSKENMKKMMEAYDGYAKHVEALEKGFMDDFKSTLTPKQAEAWPKVERRRRLAEAGAMGSVSGGTTNLVDVLDRTLNGEKLPAEAAPVLDQYEQDMDTAVTDLLAWQADIKKKMKELGEKMSEMSMEEQQKFGMEMMGEVRKKAAAATDVNNRALPKIAAVLPENLRDRFQIDYYRQSYFQFYDRGGATMDRAFDAVAKLEGVTDEQKKAVADIRKAHETESLALYKETAQARDKELAEAKDQAAMFGGASLQNFMQKVPDMQKKVVEKVRAALTPELLAKLPAPFKTVDVKEPKFDE